MTTIAYRNGIIAADCQSECNGWIVPQTSRKIRRICPHTVAAICGDRAVFEPWLKWFRGDRESPFETGDNARVVFVSASEGITIYEGRGWFRFDGPFGAWGSGWPAAVAAMHMGADAKRAIEVAALVDPSTGGEVQVMSVSVAGAVASDGMVAA